MGSRNDRAGPASTNLARPPAELLASKGGQGGIGIFGRDRLALGLGLDLGRLNFIPDRLPHRPGIHISDIPQAARDLTRGSNCPPVTSRARARPVTFSGIGFCRFKG